MNITVKFNAGGDQEFTDVKSFEFANGWFMVETPYSDTHVPVDIISEIKITCNTPLF